MIAILRVGGGEVVGVQGRGTRAGSMSQGLESMTVRMKRTMPVREVLRGPITAAMGSAPAAVEHHPSVGMRKAVGLKP